MPPTTAHTQIRHGAEGRERQRERHTPRDQAANLLESPSTTISLPAIILLGIYSTEMETRSHKNLYKKCSAALLVRNKN